MDTSLKSVWTDSFTIHWCDAGTKGKASIIALSRFLQESALRHADHLGVGFRENVVPDKIWVVVRMLVDVKRYPLWGETFSVHTWPRGVEGHFALRDFEIIDGNGNVICAATSRWLILDAVSHSPLSIQSVLSFLPLADPRKAIEAISTARIPAGLFVLVKEYTVQYSDLDRHNHVNNTCYIGWIMNAYSGDWHNGHEITGFRIDYLSESRLDDVIEIYADNPDALEAWIKAVRVSDGKTIFKALITWSL
jgi:medium-chain acyl-[acyl-carrier-protein] hydrolase